MVKIVTDNSFNEEVLNSTKIVVVDFWAEWCGPCRALAPILEEISNELVDVAKICKIDIENNPDIASKMEIRSIPTLMIFKDGKMVATRAGALPKNSLLEWIKSNV